MKLFQNLTSDFGGKEFWRISLRSTQWKKLLPMAAIFFDGSKFREQFWKGSHKEQSYELFQILTSSLGEEEFLRISFCPYSAKSPPPPPHGDHVFRRIKILQKIFKKGHPRNNLVKLFQILTSGFGKEEFLRISLCPYSAKSLPPHGNHAFRRIKILQTIFEKGHPVTILWNYFKIWLAISEEKNFEEFLWSPHSEKSFSPWPPFFSMDQNFVNNFEKGHTRNNLMNYSKFWPAV